MGLLSTTPNLIRLATVVIIWRKVNHDDLQQFFVIVSECKIWDQGGWTVHGPWSLLFKIYIKLMFDYIRVSNLESMSVIL